MKNVKCWEDCEVGDIVLYNHHENPYNKEQDEYWDIVCEIIIKTEHGLGIRDLEWFYPEDRSEFYTEFEYNDIEFNTKNDLFKEVVARRGDPKKLIMSKYPEMFV